ncbi:hypothetical protein CEV08_09340, partial [Bartonella tribocorum]
MKKRSPSPRIVEMMQKFQQQDEQSLTNPPQGFQSTQAATIPLSTENPEDPSTHTKKAPSKPPRAKDREQNTSTTQERKNLYETSTTQTSLHMKDAEQTSIEVPKPETIAPSVRSKTPSEQSGSSNEPKTSINPMEKRILLEAHQEGIRFLCNK